MVKAYCMKEKKKDVTVKDPHYEFDARGTAIVKGKCASCGGSVRKFLSADDVKEAPSDFQKKFEAKKAKKGRGSLRSKTSKSQRSRKSRKSRRSKK